MNSPTVGDLLAQAYVTLAPAIFAAMANMVWVKLPWAQSLNRPLDGGLVLADHRRLFGDNKTWKGLIGLVVLGALLGAVWGLLIHGTALEQHNLFFLNHPQPGIYWTTGALQGLAYGLFELPNSFLKRRVGIVPGAQHEGPWKVLFILIDQIDSVFGCALLVLLFAPVGWKFVLVAVAVGAVTHLVLNLLLYMLKLRRNPL